MQRAFAVLLLLYVTVHAVVVPSGPISNINTAIAAANQGDTIQLSGVYDTCNTSIILNKNVTILGPASIRCNSTGTVFKTAAGCSGASISSINIYNATTAISHVVAYNITVNNLFVEYSGTGIDCRSCGVTILNSRIIRSLLRAINAESTAKVTVKHTDMSYGGGDGGGGGIYVAGSTSSLQVINCTFCYNSINGMGSAIHVTDQAKADISDSLFDNNHASSVGTVYVDGPQFASTATITNCIFKNNTGNNGGGLYVAGKVNVYNTRITGNNVTSSGGAITTSSPTNNYLSELRMWNVVIDWNWAQYYYGAMDCGGIVEMHNCIISNNDASMDPKMVKAGYNMTATNTSFVRNGGYALYSYGSGWFILDSDCVICGNENPGTYGATIVGTPRVCDGTITNVNYGEGAYNYTMYPGVTITFSGRNLLRNSTDYISKIILVTKILTVNMPTSPYSFTMPDMVSVKTGVLLVRSYYGFQSESSDIFTFETTNITSCGVSVATGPEPSVVTVDRVVPVSFTLNYQCYFIPSVKCYFGTDVASGSNSLAAAVCNNPSKATVQTLPIVLQFNQSNYIFNLTASSLTYYPEPVPASVYPTNARSDVTNLTICSFTKYPWAKPQCLFSDPGNGWPSVFHDAWFVNDSCVSCTYYNHDECKLVSDSLVAVSLYGTQASKQVKSVGQTCSPLPVDTFTLDPPFVVMSSAYTNDVSVILYGMSTSPKDNLKCKFNGHVTNGTWIDASTIKCPVPYIEVFGDVMLYISNDDDAIDWYSTTTLSVKHASDCPVVVGSPVPSFGANDQHTDVSVVLNNPCGYVSQVRCFFGSADPVTAVFNSTAIVCKTPTYAGEGYVDMKVEVKLPGYLYNTTSPFQYYSLSFSTATPTVGISNSTVITVCGLHKYSWANTRCWFSQSQAYVSATFVNDTCATCVYYNPSDCTAKASDRLYISYIGNQNSLSYSPVLHVCAPVVPADTIIMPSFVIISPNMTTAYTFVSGSFFVASEYLSCKYGDLGVANGTWLNDDVIQCHVPYVSVAAYIQLYVSNDHQTWVPAAMFEFSKDGRLTCGPGLESGGSKCVECATGSYKNTTSTLPCTRCGSHMTTSVTGARDITQCKCDALAMTIVKNYSSCECDAGYDMRNGECTQCDIGYYKEIVSDNPCTYCGQHLKTPTTGSTNSSACTCMYENTEKVYNGSVLNCYCAKGFGLTKDGCVKCEVGYFKSEVENLGCQQCPVKFTTRDSQSMSSNDCYCQSGYAPVLDKAGNVVKCDECDKRAVCKGGRDLPEARAGYYSSSGLIITCIPDKACLAASKCQEGYHGDRCSACDEGYYRVQFECKLCSTFSTGWRVPLLVLGAIVACIYLYRQTLKGAKVNVKIAGITLAYSFIQVFALIGGVPTDINEPYKSTFQSTSSTNFNIQVLALECDHPGLDYYGMFVLRVLLPVFVIGILWCVVYAHISYTKYVKELPTDTLVSAGISTTVVLTTMLYLAVTSQIMSFVGCSMLENGEWVLDASPDLECFTGRHLGWMVLFLLSFVAYVIGVPVVLFFIVVKYRKQEMDKNDGQLPEIYIKRFGFMSLKYHDATYWWELVVMARKALLVIAFTVWSRSLSVKIEMAALVLIMSVYLQKAYAPFNIKVLDDIESVTLLANSLVLVAGLGVFVGAGSAFTVYAIFFIMIAGCVGVLVWIGYTIYKYQKGDSKVTDQSAYMKLDFVIDKE